MAIETNCPGCDAKLSVPDEHAGRSARCPVCKEIYQVEAATESASTNEESQQTAPSVAVEQSPTPLRVRNSEAIEDHSNWWLRTSEGQMFGPVSRDELHGWVSQGRVTCNCQIRADDEQDWRGAEYYYPILNWTQLQIQNATLSRHQASLSPQQALMRSPASTANSQNENYVEAHRAQLVLTFAILAFPTLCPVFSILAWSMGQRDLHKMQLGRMDRSGWDLTQAGRILGILFTVVWPAIAGIGFYLLVYQWNFF